MTYELRPHQIEAISRIRESFRTKHRTPLLQASTGFGKTLVAIDIIKSALAKGKRVLFVVDRIQLIDQTSESFDKHGLHHGVIQGDHWRTNNEPLQLASVQTLVRRRNLPESDFIIVDECHCRTKAFDEIITKTWSALPFLGLSATPFAKGLGLTYDDLIVIEDTASLIDKGFLCDYVAYGAEIDLSGIRTTAGDYNQKDLSERVNKRKIVGDVVKTWLKLGENRQTVCFAVSVAHSESIVDEFKANGVTAAHMDSHTSAEDRDRIFEAHASGEIKILSNVGITTKGWDSPETTCLIYAKPTKSLMLHIQILGRILRVSSCKTDAIILDHGSNIERLGFPTDQLPEFLCNGDKDSAERKQADDEEKKEKLPTACEKCTHLSVDFICPKCGHKPEKVPNVEAVEGTLKKMKRIPQADKSRWYAMLLGYSRQKGYKEGWASNKYRDKFGTWPHKKIGVNAVAPDSEVMKYITYGQIKFAKRRN